MRTEVYQRADGEWVTHVFLSRRNLLSLLAKLDGAPLGSIRTIGGPIVYPATMVTAEEDDVHYEHESRAEMDGVGAAGRMHPETEAAMEGKGDPEYGLRIA